MYKRERFWSQEHPNLYKEEGLRVFEFGPHISDLVMVLLPEGRLCSHWDSPLMSTISVCHQDVDIIEGKFGCQLVADTVSLPCLTLYS